MRPGFRTPSGPRGTREGRPLELVRVRGAQRNSGDEGRNVNGRGRRRGGRGRGRGRARGVTARPPAPRRLSLWTWLKRLLAPVPARAPRRTLSEQEARTLADFSRHFSLTFTDATLLKLALTHRSYLSVTGQGPRESNERLEFLGDSVLGLVTSEFLYRQHPDEHEGQLTKTKSLLVSKAILSRRALAMGLGRFVLMSHSEVESGGRQRLSILADAFEAVIGAVYLDQGFESARAFIHQWLLKDTKAIAADDRHANYKSHLQEYVQSTFHTHPVYRIRSEYGPDHSKHFMVEVMVGKRVLGSGKGRNKKEAEQAAARDALEQANAMPQAVRPRELAAEEEPVIAAVPEPIETADEKEMRRRRRGRRGGRGRRRPAGPGEPVDAVSISETEEPEREPSRPRVTSEAAARDLPPEPEPRTPEAERSWAPARNVESSSPILRSRRRSWLPPDDEENEEIGRPEGPLDERHVDPYDWQGRSDAESQRPESRREEPDFEEQESAAMDAESSAAIESESSAAEPVHRDRNAERRRPPEESDEEAELPSPAAESERPAPPAPTTPRYGRRGRGRR
ncbi:MAG TPA: ribonuclease III [Candidatus Udaeobacter sp.]|jgi:ribonuclease-3|nr:ribonuclease III [Candidatus Udaeobacter sp.]